MMKKFLPLTLGILVSRGVDSGANSDKLKLDILVLSRLCLVLFVAVGLSACGGGGGGGGGVSSSVPFVPLNKERQALLVYHSGAGSGATQSVLDQIHGTHGITGKGVTVGVVDSGYSSLNRRHPDLPSGRMEILEGGTNRPVKHAGVKDLWHGLAVAGVIGASRGGGYSVGVAPEARIAFVNMNTYGRGGGSTSTGIPLPDTNAYEKLGRDWATGYFNSIGMVPAPSEVNGIRESFLTGVSLKNDKLAAVNFSYVYLGPRASLWNELIYRLCFLDPVEKPNGTKESRCLKTPHDRDSGGNPIKRGIVRMSEAFDAEYARLVLREPAKDTPTKFVELRQLIKDLGDNGVVSVVALGNYRQHEYFATAPSLLPKDLYKTIAPSDVYPAVFAKDPAEGGISQDEIDLRKSVLVVGALEGIGSSWSTITKWRQASYSSGCGALLKARCLFAPVTRFNTDDVNADKTPAEHIPLLNLRESGLIMDKAGTSFAAPQVSGAIALLVEKFKERMDYDGKVAAQNLLDTAVLVEDGSNPACKKDMMTGLECRRAGGADALPDATGNGRMDILAALNIVGPPLVLLGTSLAGESLPLEGSVLRSGAPFGDALIRAYDTFADAIVIDELGRAFADEFAYRVSAMPTQRSDAILLASPRAQKTGLTARSGNSRLDFRFSARTDAFILSDPVREAHGADLFSVNAFGASALLDAPEFSLAHSRTDGSGDGGVRERTLWFGFSDSALRQRSDAPDNAGDVNPRDTERGRRLLRLGGVEKFGGAGHLRWEFATLSEDSQVLGGVNDGLLGLGVGSESRFVSLGLGYGLGGGWRVFADTSFAEVGAGGGGILRSWRGVRARGWSFGAMREGVENRFGVRLSQPLRVEGGTLHLDYPARILADGDTIERRQAEVSLVPSGRELRLELTATRALSDRASLESRLLLRRDPGHNANASDTLGGSIGVRVHF
ncbi:MAG: S8 family serine peptidase [Alphaproteobacteria bacterium]